MVSMVHKLMKQWEKDHPAERRKPTKKRGKKKKTKRKKAWDCTTTDLSKHKLSEEEMLNKRKLCRSKHHAQAQKLVKQAKKSNLAKQREEIQKKKESMMRKWDRRIKKAKRVQTKATAEAEIDDVQTSTSDQEVESLQPENTNTGEKVLKEVSETTDDTPKWEWGTSASSSMDVLDDKLVKLQKEFHQFESRVRKELREPEPVISPVTTPLTSTMEQLIDQVQGLSSQILGLTQQVSKLQSRVEQLEAQPSKVPEFQQPPAFDPIPPMLGIDLLGRSFLPSSQQRFPEPFVGRKFNEPNIVISSSFPQVNTQIAKM